MNILKKLTTIGGNKSKNYYSSPKFIDHILELRKRFIFCVIAFIAAFALSYYNIESIFFWLAQPLIHNGADNLIYTNIGETFFTYMSLSAAFATAICIPFFMLQIYLFLSSGLYREEKIMVSGLFIGFVIMFLFGASILYYAILPEAISFLLHYQESDIMPISFHAKISEYAQNVIELIIAFGLAFQFPIILFGLVKIDLITIDQLKKFRKPVIVAIFVVAAIVTPPDIMSQIILAFILMFFYEATIIICKLSSSHDAIKKDDEKGEKQSEKEKSGDKNKSKTKHN